MTQAKELTEADLVGRQIGKYRVTRLLGRGGMGAVFEMIHESIGQRAAVKILFSQYAQDPEFVERFFHEAKVVNQIQHQGVVKAFDHGQLPDGNLYIIMELLIGESLRARIETLAKEKTRFDFTAAAAILIQIADTLQEVHSKGVIHRDLKPENIFLVRDSAAFGGQRAKILDFGIAKIQEGSELRDNDSPGPLTTMGKILGTPTYMSPEQCDGRQALTPASDIYALGVILYEMLSGEPPFGGASGNSVMAMHMLKEPAPLSQVPRPLDILIRGMLTKKPEQRPSLTQVHAALQAFVDRPVPAPRSSSALVAGISTLLLLGGGGLWWARSRSQPPVSPPGDAASVPTVPAVRDMQPSPKPDRAAAIPDLSSELKPIDAGAAPDAAQPALKPPPVPAQKPTPPGSRMLKKAPGVRSAKPVQPTEPEKLNVPIVE